MKLMRKLFSIMTICFLVVLVVACDNTKHTHKYGTWEITAEPTAQVEGKAERACQCGEKEEVTLPILTDTTVWAAKTTDATCQKEGSIEYTSEYGKVVVKLDIVDHVFGDWTITKEPTMDEPGEATRTCKFGEPEKVEIPALSNTEVWTAGQKVDPTCTVEGHQTYTSTYGEVTVKFAVVDHVFGDWTITTEPTMDEPGEATRTCKFGEPETVEIPALTNTEVWTAGEKVDPTCTIEGEQTFTSTYGEVTVKFAVVDHVYGDWTITTKPTMDTEGVATRTCEFGESETVTIPVLTNTEVWTKTVVKEANYNEKGTDQYTSIYGEVAVEVAKLVAPYDGKTYYPVHFDSRGSEGKYYVSQLNVQTSYIEGAVTFDENGHSVNTNFPFQYPTQIEMINPETGEIAMHLADSEGHEDEFKGFVDMETGVIVIMNVWDARAPFIAIPSETALTEVNATASSWQKAIVINLSVDAFTGNIYVTDQDVHFNVSISDMEGTAIAANAAYNASYVRITNASGDIIHNFVNNGVELVLSDGKEGTYTNEQDTLVVSGYGVLTLNDVDGTYTISTTETHTLDVYVADSYYEVTLEAGTYTINKPMVTITFENGEQTPIEAAIVNKNIAYVLPTPTSETHIFKGWYYDATYAEKVEEEFIPTTDVTLFAFWAEKVIINLVGVLEGEETTLILGDGDEIGAFLPQYGIEEDIMKKFVGWYLDPEMTNPLPESATVTVVDSNTTIYAKWEDLPAYYGTYYGSEIYYGGSGNYGGKVLTIDENGNMSGVKTGVITSYNPETQEIKWKAKASDTTEKVFFFDPATKTIAGIYRDTEIGNDYYFLSKDLKATNGKAKAVFGLYAPKTPADTSFTSHYAQFVEITEGTMYFLYNNHIYSSATFETTNGTAITTVAELKEARTVIIKDNGQVVLSLGTTGTKFSGNDSKTKLLDTYYGTYTASEETVVLDGVGGITYGEKTGTYTVAEGSSYGFDVYLVDNKEYYQLTLDGESFTMVKPMVTYHYVTGEGHPVVEDVSYNMNIEVTTLPTVESEGYVFKGWYTTEEYTTAVTKFTPLAETTLYAKWARIITVTVYLGEEVIASDEIESGMTYTPEQYNPTNGELVVGYFTDAELTTPYDDTVAITDSTSIYAKTMTIAPAGVLSQITNGGTEGIEEDKIYPWSVSVTEGAMTITSTNKGIGSSESQFRLVFAKDSIVSFDYYVQGEAGNCDNLYIMVKAAGSTSWVEKAKFGSKDGITGSYTINMRAGDSLALLYKKDYSADKGDDLARITNLTLTDGYPEATITYVYNDGTTANTTTTILYGDKLTEALLAAPTNTRDESLFKFDAWYLDAELTTKAVLDYEVTAESLMLYAGWKEKVTVTFVVPEGATPVDPMEVWTKEAFEATSEKTDYIFRGWYIAEDFSGEAFDLTAGVMENTTLYAKFQELPEGSAFSKAKEMVVGTVSSVVIRETITTEEFQVYYFKLVAEVSGKYNIMLEGDTKVGGSARNEASKYVIYASDMETIVKASSGLSSSKSWTVLEAGTYYVAVHLYSDPSTTITETCWGKITGFTIETFAHDEVAEAVEVTVGTDITLDNTAISSSSEDYILKLTAPATVTYQFNVTVSAWVSVDVYTDTALETEVGGSNFTASGAFTLNVTEGTIYYIVIGNNWRVGHSNSLTIGITEFAVRDAIATKTFQADHSFRCGYGTWTATTKFEFDNAGNVKVSSSSSDHDDYDNGCNDYYMPSFEGTYTYTLEGTTLTLTNSTVTMVFTLDSETAPTTMTLESTTVSSSSQGYFAVGTTFRVK